MNDLKNIVENMTETPSDKCWSVLEQQLEVVMPSTPSGSEGAANTAASNSAIVSKSAAGISKGAVAWITAGTIAAASTIAGIAWITSRPDTIIQTKTNHNNTELVGIQDSVCQEVVVEEEKYSVENIPSIQDFLTSTSSSQNSETENLLSSSNSAQAAPANSTSSLTSIVPVQSQTSSSPSSQVSQPQESLPLAQTETQMQPPIAPHESLTISEEPAVELTIPNIFTPNGDGFNDQFVIENIEYCSESRLSIRNSRGNVVFDKLNYQNDWTADGFPDGIYYYTFTYVLNGETHRVKGNVTIKRGY